MLLCTIADRTSQSSHSDGSKELVEFKYNPVYRDSDPEDIDTQTDPSSSRTSYRHGSPPRVSVNYQENTVVNDAEVYKNEYGELPPEVGVFRFSPVHSWVKKLAPDLQESFEPDEVCFNSMGTVVSSQDPNVEIQCNTIVFN